MEPPPVSIPTLRVVGAAASDVSQHLAPPVTYAPDQDGNAYAELASKDMPLSNDRSTVQQVVQLLSGADLSYLCDPPPPPLPRGCACLPRLPSRAHARLPDASPHDFSCATRAAKCGTRHSSRAPALARCAQG